jgi:hypothetical protein
MQLLDPAGALEKDRKPGADVIAPPWTYLYVDTNGLMGTCLLVDAILVDRSRKPGPCL